MDAINVEDFEVISGVVITSLGSAAREAQRKLRQYYEESQPKDK